MADGSGLTAEDLKEQAKLAKQADKEAKRKTREAQKAAKEAAKLLDTEAAWWRVERFAAISDRSQNKVTKIATFCAFIMIAINSLMLASNAFANAADSGIMATYENPAVWVPWVTGILVVCQVVLAVMMQAGTDIGLLFAAGLVKGNFKITPTLSVILFAVCCVITVHSKMGIYHSQRDVRIEELKKAEKPNTEQSQSIRWMERYEGDAPRTIPRPTDALIAAIAGYEATKSAVETDISRREKEYARLEDDAEDERKTGRGERYNGLVEELKAKSDVIAEKRGSMEGIQQQIIDANMEKAERAEYESHSLIVKAWEERPAITKSNLDYDAEVSVFARSFGATLLGILCILVAFASDKIDEAREKAEAEREKRSKASKQGHANRDPNIRTAEYEEEPAELVALTIMDGEDGVYGDADTKTVESPERKQQHPDAAGDDHGAKVNGYEGQANDTNDDNSASGDIEPDADASGDDEGQPSPSEDDGDVRG